MSFRRFDDLKKPLICGRFRFYSTKDDLRKLRPMILERIETRAGFYPVQAMVPVARKVLQAHSSVIHGVSTLLKFIPVLTCKFCSEVYIGEQGHLIRTCTGYKRVHKNKHHDWIKGSLDNIIVPVETFHLENMFQGIIKHDQRFDYDRVPAVVELCWQAGVDPYDIDIEPYNKIIEEVSLSSADSFSRDDLCRVANETLGAWETLRDGVQKLLFVYPGKVCKYCSEVHIGPSGHKARLCGIFKFQSWRGAHFWQKAKVDDLVPPKIVWRRRPQDPLVLSDEGRGFYGHAPALVELCAQAGGIPSVKYHCMMKTHGLPSTRRLSESTKNRPLERKQFGRSSYAANQDAK